MKLTDRFLETLVESASEDGIGANAVVTLALVTEIRRLQWEVRTYERSRDIIEEAMGVASVSDEAIQ